MKKITIIIILFPLALSGFSGEDIFSGQDGLQHYVIINGLVVGDDMERLIAEHRGISLFQGRFEQEYEFMSPFLFPLEPGSTLIGWLNKHSCIKKQSVFLSSSTDPEKVIHHLQQFIRIEKQHEKGKLLYLRFYDPSVMESMFRILDHQQVSSFFGPVHTWFVYNAPSGTYKKYTISSGQLADVLLYKNPSPPCWHLPTGTRKKELVNKFPQLWTFNEAIKRRVPFTDVCSCSKGRENPGETIVLSINSQQYQEFTEDQMIKFKYRLYWDFRERQSVKHISPDDLKRYVDQGSERAQEYGLTTEGMIHTFIHLMIAYGEFFDTKTSWARFILKEERLNAREKHRYLKKALRLKDEDPARLKELVDEIKTKFQPELLKNNPLL